MRSRSGLGGHAAIGALFVLALLAAAITVTVAHVAFPHGDADLDEVAYVSQANALRQHELTLPAATHDPFFRPFLSGVRGDRIVSKYQPEWPAMIAASDRLFGSTLPLRALMAIGGVLATAWFAWEVVRDRRVVVATAVLVVASPFTWMQTASLLGYQLSFVLGTAAAAALVRSSRGPTAANGITAGALLGLAVFHRPFDALLATAPVLAYWCWFTVRRRTFVRSASWVALGGMPFAGLFLAYNRAATGSLFHLVYNVTGRSDAFGFGWRASFVVPGGGHDGQVHYTVGEAFWSLRHLGVALLPRFVAFAPVVAVLAGIALWSRRRDLDAWLLAAMMMVVVVGYFFWWGVANSYYFGLDRSLGPFYYYPLLAPLCVLAAWGLMLVRRSLVVAIVTGAIAIAWGGVASTVVVRDARAAGRARATELQVLRAPGRSLVLESPLFPSDPYLRVATDAKLRDAHLVAVDAPDRRLELMDRFQGRALYLVRTYRRFDDFFGAEQRDRIELNVVRGRAIHTCTGTIASGHAGRVYLRIGSEAPRFLMSAHGKFDTTIPLPGASLGAATAATPIAVGVTVADVGEPPRADLGEDWLECGTTARRTTGGDVEVLQVCDGRHHYPFPNHAAVVEDVAPALQVEFAAS